jgi:oligopeptide transport system substrate-binding protein
MDSVDIVELGAATYQARYRFVEDYETGQSPLTSFVAFDMSRPPFDDMKVRQAFAMAADRERIANEKLDGLLDPATGGFVPPGIPGHSSGIGLPYDPSQARHLLVQVGYPDGRGFPVVEILDGNGANKAVEYLVSQWLENLNVNVTLKLVEWEKYIQERHGTHLGIGYWLADYPDPDNYLSDFVRANIPHWRDERYDQLVEEAQRTLVQARRIRLYQEADKILIEQAALVPIVYFRSHHLVKPWVKWRGWGIRGLIIEPH